jgi:PKD repeat protein
MKHKWMFNLLILVLVFSIVPLTVSALAPVADFSVDSLSGTTASYFTFTDASTNTPTSWYWEYSLDSGTNWVALSSDQNPYITLLEGSNSIRLTATNDDGSDDETKLDYITITAPPTITIDSITPNTGVNTSAYVPVTITGTNFTGALASRVYNSTYDISMFIKDFTVNSDNEISGYFNLADDGDGYSYEEGYYYISVYDFEYVEYVSDIPFIITSESEPTPTPTETPSGITSTHTSTQIEWHWDACGDPSLIDNISIDNYNVCSFNMSLQTFLLTGLDPSTSHVINITCLGESTLNWVTTDAAPVSLGGGFVDESNILLWGLIGGVLGGLLVIAFYLRGRRR